jgi:hypothetical protein
VRIQAEIARGKARTANRAARHRLGEGRVGRRVMSGILPLAAFNPAGLEHDGVVAELCKRRRDVCGGERGVEAVENRSRLSRSGLHSPGLHRLGRDVVGPSGTAAQNQGRGCKHECVPVDHVASARNHDRRPDEERPAADVLACGPGQVGRVAESTLILHADVGRELALDLVAETKALSTEDRPAPMPSSGTSWAARSSSTRGCKISRLVSRWSYSASTRAVSSPLVDRNSAASISNQ